MEDTSGVQSGPAVELSAETLARINRDWWIGGDGRRFGELTKQLQDWRMEDHEDWVRLSRSDVIALVEGIARIASRPV